MLNPFPELLAFQFSIIAFVRVVLAFIFLRWGWNALFSDRHAEQKFWEKARLPKPKIWAYLVGTLELIGGLLLLAGAFVQYVAIALSILAFGFLFLKDRDHPHLKSSADYYMLLFALTFAMIFFGAGAFAVDVPL